MEIKINQGILSSNDRIALENKKLFDDNGLLVINLMGSPGAGKTAVLEKTIDLLSDSVKLAVIEGDIYTSKDAERIERLNNQLAEYLSVVEVVVRDEE